MDRRVAARLRVLAVLVLAVVVTSAFGGDSTEVRHALVSEPAGAVEVWKDTATAELAFRFQGEDRVTILRGRFLFLIEGGRLIERSTYSASAQQWRRIHEEYGLTAGSTEAALAAGEIVVRPGLMNAPPPRWNGPGTYQSELHFGTDVQAQRRAAGFWAPSPGLKLDGLRMADAALLRIRGPWGADSGPVALLVYSADPAREGTGEPELGLDATPSTSSWGRSYAAFFAKSRTRLVGRAYDARLVPPQVILRHRGTYVAIVAHGWTPTQVQWRAILTRVVR